MISITQDINHYAQDFLLLLDSWADKRLPQFFIIPSDKHKRELWQNCLRSCTDYFGEGSKEYKLLEKGIVLHHGKMPGIMSRLLTELIQQQIIYVVLATSTLSEGVNLPFETILIPSLQRWGVDEHRQINITKQEFENLIGRAGRPGAGTEGRSLILLSARSDWGVLQARKRYFSLIDGIRNENTSQTGGEGIKSPLAKLLSLIVTKWIRLTGSRSRNEFLKWLENTIPIEYEHTGNNGNLELIQYLDSLDFHLLSSIQEIEQSTDQLEDIELEEKLIRIWQRSFARYVIQSEKQFDKLFIHRGLALKKNVYPTKKVRNRLYRAGLPPREGNQLINLYPVLKDILITGSNYALWDAATKIKYIAEIIEVLSEIPRFCLDNEPGQGKNRPSWKDILYWWLFPSKCTKKPNPSNVASWYGYVSRNFIYKFSWGLGNAIALAICEEDGASSGGLTLQEWPSLGLPWVVFWLKEIIQWGTLDPVATCLLSHGFASTRIEAENLASQYYLGLTNKVGDEIYNASNIKEWMEETFSKPLQEGKIPFKNIEVNLKRNFRKAKRRLWRVFPIKQNETLLWIDPAGYPLAECSVPLKWDKSYINRYDFILDVDKKEISLNYYI